MPLQLLPLEETDIDRFAIIDEAAMANWPYAEAIIGKGEARITLVAKWLREGWGKNPAERYMKVVDTETGEMVAACMYELHPEPKAKDDELSSRHRAPGDEAKAASVWEESGRLAREFDAEFVGARPYVQLNLVATHPDHQRRGAGSLLVAHVCKEADERGLLCRLTASQAGLAAYLKHGFEVKKIVPLDLRPYGFDSIEDRRFMIRPAKDAAAA